MNVLHHLLGSARIALLTFLLLRAVAYRRAGGTSFWTAAPGGVEEWLHLEAGAVRGGEPVATWEIDGATVRPRGAGAELVDAGGVLRLKEQRACQPAARRRPRGIAGASAHLLA